MAPNEPRISRVLQSSPTVFSYLRLRIRHIAKAAVALAVIIELGGIWNEVHHMRNEQVKNALYALPQARRSALKGTPASRHMESTTFIDGSVSVDGPVELNEPVEVEISR